MMWMTRFLVSAAITAVGLSFPNGADAQTACGTASYRLYNSSFDGPRALGGCRTEPVPGYNLGLPWMNPRGTGMDDPWRPPHKWPQTRYPVVPAYTRSSYGYYETSWRTIPIANSVAANPAPSAAPAPPQAAPPPQKVTVPQTPIPQAPIQQVPPQKVPIVAPVPSPGANSATPPQASPSMGPPKAVPPQTAPPKTVPPKTVPPKTGVPEPVPGQKPQRPPEAAPAVPAPTPGFGETMPNDAPQPLPARTARVAPATIDDPEIEVQAF